MSDSEVSDHEAGTDALREAVETMRTLRSPGGCPWDAEQTHASLVTYLIEEAHELAEAIEAGTEDDVREELGDVLLQVLFHAEIARGEGRFDIGDVARGLSAKMQSRHPHVYGDVSVAGADDVVANWDELKRAEKPERESALDGIPQGLPALARAGKVLSRAAKRGITVPAPVVSAQASSAVSPAEISSEAELGEQLLALARAGYDAGFDAERAVRAAVRALEQSIRAAEEDVPADAS